MGGLARLRPVIPALLALAGTAVHAADEPPGTEPTTAENAETEPDNRGGADDAPAANGGKGSRSWYLRTMDFTHTTLSHGIEGTAKGIDAFFATDEALEEATKSFVRIGSDARWVEHAGFRLEGSADARLDLPGTEERFQLLVESDSEQAGQDQDPLADSQAAQEEGNDDLGVAIEAWLEGDRDVNWQLRPAVGIRGGLPPNPFARFRVIRRDQYAKWDSRFETTLAYFYQDGVIFNASKDFDRPLSDSWLFRTRTTYRWSRDEELTSAGERLSLYHTITERRRAAYEIGLTGDDEPGWGIDTYFARIRYRQRIYKHWLFAEVQPQVRWLKAIDFDNEAALIFRLEAVFGERALRRSRRTANP
jgi:hypothetical protein